MHQQNTKFNWKQNVKETYTDINIFIPNKSNTDTLEYEYNTYTITYNYTIQYNTVYYTVL